MGFYDWKFYMIGCRISLEKYAIFKALCDHNDATTGNSFIDELNKGFGYPVVVPDNLGIREFNNYAYIYIKRCDKEINKIEKEIKEKFEEDKYIYKLRNIVRDLTKKLILIDTQSNEAEYCKNQIEILKGVVRTDADDYDYKDYEKNIEKACLAKFNSIKLFDNEIIDITDLYTKIMGERPTAISVYIDTQHFCTL